MSKLKTTTKKSKIKIIFLGNTKYSIIGARIINTVYPITLFVTIPDCPVRDLALDLKIPFIETTVLDKTILEEIKKINPDFLVVEDYGLILPQQFLDIPNYAPLNIHHSLLPKYRGPSPAPFAILNGDTESGVSIIEMVNQVDAGDILAQEKYKLTEKETTDTLLTKLNQLGGELMIQVIKQYVEGTQNPLRQEESKATFTKHFEKIDGYFDIDNPPTVEKLDKMIRAYFPWPGVWCKWKMENGKWKIVKLLPNQMIQMEGKKPISLKDFLNGYPDFPIKQMR